MLRPEHRAVPNPSDLSPYTEEERWLLHEPREPGGWIIGTDKHHQRMSRFRREIDK